MFDARIIKRVLNHPSGEQAKWFEIEKSHGGKPHRESRGDLQTEEAARLAAAAEGCSVDPKLYVEER